MYDTIRIQLKHTATQHQTLLTLLYSLGKVDERKNGISQTVTYYVKYRYWQFTLTPTYLYCTGSLPQLLYGTNLVNFTISDTRLAINELNKILKVDISDAKVTRIDFAYNFLMTYPVSTYFKVLCHKSYCKVNTFGAETLTFKGSNEEFTFYDKIAQLKSKGENISNEYSDKHLLRYEMKLTESISKKLGYDVITVADLISEDFYQVVKEHWYTSYQLIDKLSYDIPDYGNNVSEFKDYLMLRGIDEIGLSTLFNDVDTVFKSKTKAKNRIKTMLRKLTANREKLIANIALAELDEKMLSIIEMAS